MSSTTYFITVLNAVTPMCLRVKRKDEISTLMSSNTKFIKPRDKPAWHSYMYLPVSPNPIFDYGWPFLSKFLQGIRIYGSLQDAYIWAFHSHIPALEFTQICGHVKTRIYAIQMVVYTSLKPIRNVCKQVYAAEKNPIYPVQNLKRMANYFRSPLSS